MNFKIRIVLNLFELSWMKKRYVERISVLQTKRWNRFQRILLKSPFYAENAKNRLPLEAYPVMNKSTFMEHFDEINTHGIKLEKAYNVAFNAENSRDFSPMIGEVTVGLSSGTSGNRGIFLATEKERAQWVASVLDRVIGFSLKKRSVAFFLRANSNLYDSVKSSVLRFEFFDLFNAINEHVGRLNELQPTILVAQPSMLLELAREIENRNLRISPKKVISVAEVLYPEDKEILENIFGQIIHQVYQCTEGFLASTCKAGTLHFNEDFLIIEKKYLDDTHTRFHPIITDLMRSSQPVVRYELNDIIHEKKECACGSKTLAIEQIEGRSDDVLVFKSKNGDEVKIFPDFFRRAVIMSDEEISDYAIIQRSRDLLDVYINGTEKNFENAKKGIYELLSKYETTFVEIQRINTNEHEKGNKLRRIKNESN